MHTLRHICFLSEINTCFLYLYFSLSYAETLTNTFIRFISSYIQCHVLFWFLLREGSSGDWNDREWVHEKNKRKIWPCNKHPMLIWWSIHFHPFKSLAKWPVTSDVYLRHQDTEFWSQLHYDLPEGFLQITLPNSAFSVLICKMCLIILTCFSGK